MDLEHERRLTEVEARASSNTKRLNKLEESTEALNRMAISMEVMAEKQDRVADTVDRLDSKVEALEGKPAKKWESLEEKVLLTLVAAIIGYFLAKLGIVA